MSIRSQAVEELKRINFGEEDTQVMLEILDKFLDQWDSGGAVAVASGVLRRLIAGKPLSPITGDDSEWLIHDMDECYAQNIRCSTIFKDSKDGPAYDIDVPGRPPITFPYWPEKDTVDMPVIVFEP
jgi:hypothetical protein